MSVNTELPNNIDEILEKMVNLKGSDLHISVNNPAMVRVNGEFTKKQNQTC